MQLQVTPGGFAKCFAFCKTFRCTKSLKGLRTAKPPGDVTEARRDFVTSFRRFSSVANFGTNYFLSKIKFLARNKREFTTKFAILPNACSSDTFGEICVLFSPKNRSKVSLLLFILIISR